MPSSHGLPGTRLHAAVRHLAGSAHGKEHPAVRVGSYARGQGVDRHRLSRLCAAAPRGRVGAGRAGTRAATRAGGARASREHGRNAMAYLRWTIAAILSLAGSCAQAADAALIDAAKTEGEVVWYTTQIISQLVRPVSAAFEKKLRHQGARNARQLDRARGQDHQ